jgi:hypothetical protein
LEYFATLEHNSCICQFRLGIQFCVSGPVEIFLRVETI